MSASASSPAVIKSPTQYNTHDIWVLPLIRPVDYAAC